MRFHCLFIRLCCIHNIDKEGRFTFVKASFKRLPVLSLHTREIYLDRYLSQ